MKPARQQEMGSLDRHIGLTNQVLRRLNRALVLIMMVSAVHIFATIQQGTASLLARGSLAAFLAIGAYVLWQLLRLARSHISLGSFKAGADQATHVGSSTDVKDYQ